METIKGIAMTIVPSVNFTYTAKKKCLVTEESSVKPYFPYGTPGEFSIQSIRTGRVESFYFGGYIRTNDLDDEIVATVYVPRSPNLRALGLKVHIVNT